MKRILELLFKFGVCGVISTSCVGFIWVIILLCRDNKVFLTLMAASVVCTLVGSMHALFGDKKNPQKSA